MWSRGLGLALVAAAAAAGESAAQLPVSSAAELGIGGHATATSRGFAAVATNPAGLAMPRPAHLTFSVLPIGLGSGMGPVTLGDVGRHDLVPAPVREAWLERIEAEGAQKGHWDASVTAAAVASGRFGFQLATAAHAVADLNPDASELLLFGNEGRTGEPRNFHLGGSRLDAWVVTTAAVAGALPVPLPPDIAAGGSLAVGATLKYTLGNALVLGRDLGSYVSWDEVRLRFPIVQTRPGSLSLRGGHGLGLDVGAQWERGPWGAGLVVTNALAAFRWDVEALVFRPGTALFSQDATDSEFAPLPAGDAPAPLLDPVREFRFARRVAMGAVHHGERLTLSGDVGGRVSRGVDPDPGFEAGLGAEYRLRDGLPLRGHASVLSEGVRLGGGAGALLGDVHLSAAGSWLLAGTRSAWAAMFAVSLGGA